MGEKLELNSITAGKNHELSLKFHFWFTSENGETSPFQFTISKINARSFNLRFLLINIITISILLIKIHLKSFNYKVHTVLQYTMLCSSHTKIQFWICWSLFGFGNPCPRKTGPVNTEIKAKLLSWRTISKSSKIEHCRYLECSSDLWTNICGLDQIKQ